MSRNAQLETMLREYETLRGEIIQSISLQYKIITAGIIFLGTALGIAFEYHLVFLVIPPVLAAFFSLWVTEQSRMMRAGNYIQMLEDKINIELKGTYVFWENWLRVGNPPLSRTHCISQYIGIPISFIVICCFAIGAIWYFPLPELTGLAREGVTVVYLILLGLIGCLAVTVIPHRRMETKKKCEEILKEFEEAKERYGKILREFEKTKKGV